MRFKIFVIGPKMEKFYLEAIKEYEKRLRKYCKVELLHLKTEELLQKNLHQNNLVLFISHTGKTISSEELALKIDRWSSTGMSDVAIIIGTNSTHNDSTLTLSQMEMSSGSKTTILFEQIYRAYRIINNHPYHKKKILKLE
ncbi:50S rRNA methyltransferase [Paenibacillus sp. 28ISP30-2]|nr:50S rRNA methyltransferase [Paenibacillus sp. 28ISP30-2]